MRSVLLTLFALSLAAAPAGAQPYPVPGMESNPFPVIGIPTNQDEAPDHSIRLPYRDLATEIRIELPAGTLYDFDRGKVRDSAVEYLDQAANLIFGRANGPVRVECRSDRSPPAVAQKLAEGCAHAISQWLIVQGKLSKLKFTAVGLSGAPRAAVDPVAPAPLSAGNVTISFAK